MTRISGKESCVAAEDWIGTVDGLVCSNSWNFHDSLQFVRANIVNAGRSWYLSESFTSWNDFKAKSRDAFFTILVCAIAGTL